MRIAYLCLEHQQSRQHISGYAVHLNEMIGAMRSLGHEVHPIVLGEWLSAGDTQGTERSGSGAKQLAKRLTPGPLWEALKDRRVMRIDKRFRARYTQELKAFRPDAIYEQTPFMAVSGLHVARHLGVPVMRELHAPMVQERTRDGRSSLLAPLAQRREDRMLREATCIRAVSSALKAHIVERGIDASKILVQPNGADVEKFRLDPAERSAKRLEFGYDEAVVIGFTGSIFRWHGVDALIEGFAQAHNDDARLRLLIVGDGENMAELREQASGLLEHGIIRFTGNVPHAQVRSHIAAMDVCVSPNSHWYGSPLKILEYGAMQRAVIGPDLLAVRDVLTNEENSLLVTPGDAEGIRGAINRLSSDTELRTRLADRFYARVCTELTWRRVAENILAWLDQFAGGAPIPDGTPQPSSNSL